MLIVLALFIALALIKPAPPAGWIGGVLFLVFAGAATYANWVIDCPKCQVPFGQMVWQVSFPSIGLMPIKVCPHCALDLDSEWPLRRD
ncbi:hypothetical protein [Arenimonas donghaensis]|uniref:hypothetical protein n=1 Tax=Arenimonas donghaensis TaxID=375061 RepID=UPI000AB1889A|nr:hypothetical protein [Arenimonas donghaensis]